MKKIILILWVTTSLFYSYSQTEGVIHYAEKRDISGAMESIDNTFDSVQEETPELSQLSGIQDQLKEMLKGMENIETSLFFNTNESIYKQREKDISESDIGGGGFMEVAIDGAGIDDVYLSLEEKEKITVKNFMGQDFLIKKKTGEIKWKLDGEKKEIKNYSCIKAAYEDTSVLIEAWFAPQIPISYGPKGLNGLPGMILAAKYSHKKEKEKEKDLTLIVSEIEFKKLNNNSIKKPKKGKVLSSEEELNKIIGEKLGDMSGGRSMSIKIETSN